MASDNKNDDDNPADFATTSQVPAADAQSPAPAQPARRGLPALAIVGLALGGVVAAGALFGGGVFIGAHIPDRGARLAGIVQNDDRTPGDRFGPGSNHHDGFAPNHDHGQDGTESNSETDTETESGTDTGA